MRQHALHTLDRRRHDRQAVTPATLTVQAVDGVEIIGRSKRAAASCVGVTAFISRPRS